MARRKRASRRRLKRQFMRGRWLALEDIYNRRLVDFIAGRYESDDRRMIRRYFKVSFVLDEMSADNLRAVLFGDEIMTKGTEHAPELDFAGMQKMVHENLDDAIANEYDISAWPADDIVRDLMAYSWQCEDYGEDKLKPHVESWLAARKNIQ